METPEDRFEAFRRASERRAYVLHAGRQVTESRPLRELYDEFISGDILESLIRERDSARTQLGKELARRFVLCVEDCVLGSGDSDARAKLARLPSHEIEQRALVREELFEVRGEVRRRLGYPTGLDRARARRSGVDFQRYVREAEVYLDRTQAAYEHERRSVLAYLGLDPGKADAGAVAAIDHLGARFEELFPARRARDCMDLLLVPMSIRPSRRVEVDAEEREGRVPGVGVFAVSPPTEVVLSLGVHGGASAYVSTFFAMGRALAAAHVSESLPSLRRRAFDPALERAWGALFSERFTDPVWLEAFPAGRHAEALLRALRFRQLFSDRRAAARMLFGWELAALPSGESPRRLSGRFEDLQEQATGLVHPAPLYLDAQDAELGAVDELRGRAFARTLVGHLRERFGWQFWRERRAGALLQELWNTGSTYSVEELAHELALGELDLSSWTEFALRGI